MDRSANAKSHYKKITLDSPGAYTYYVRCQDTVGNADLSDYTVSFSVAVPSAPTVSMTAPSNDTTVSGSSLALTATASDGIAVAGVTFYHDANVALGAEDTSNPYSITLDTTTLADGLHTLFAVARNT